LASDTGVGEGALAAGGVIAIIILIIVYAIAGFVAGVLTAVFYNIVGGIRINTR
jgi:archaellum component FlaG (FlaF/FlaG flagellin family)